MYQLRRLIRDGEVAADSGLRSVESGAGGEVEPLMDEALQSKCPEDGQNLLMYSAAQGNEAWFIHLVGEIRSRVSAGRSPMILSTPYQQGFSPVVERVSTARGNNGSSNVSGCLSKASATTVRDTLMIGTPFAGYELLRVDMILA